MKTISDVIKSIMREQPYYGMFACGLKKEFSNEIDTAGVCLDGINYKLLINKNYWDGLTKDQRIGVMRHELGHLLFFHVTDHNQWSDLCPNHEMLNVAMD